MTWQAAYRHIFPAEFLESLVISPSRWEERLNLGATTQVLTFGEELVGYCSSALQDDSGWGEILAVYVHPDHQRRGHGSVLLAAGLDTLADSGCTRALLWVFERNAAARSFYESRAWELGRPIRLEDIGGTQVTLVRYERLTRSVA